MYVIYRNYLQMFLCCGILNKIIFLVCGGKIMRKNVWKIWCIALTALMLVAAMSVLVSADSVPAGYIQISTKEELNNIRNNLNGKYILMNDIVFSDADFEAGGDFYNGGIGWLPIGGVFRTWSSDYNEFTGVFDGNGYSIKI